MEKSDPPTPMSEPNEISEKERYHTDPTYFPDGGARAWSQAVVGFFVFFVTWGITTSFGAFQTYFKTILLPHTTTFQLGWINSIQTAFIMMGGAISGRFFDAGYFYYLITIGSILSFVCFILIAECTEYYQFLLAQGVGFGLGMGIMFSPTVACSSSYFKKKRDIVMSISAAGGGFGGVIFPIATNNLLTEVGYKWSIRILAFIDLFGLSVILILARDRFSPETRRKHQAKNNANSMFSWKSWVDPTALKDPVFMFFVFGIGLSFLGLYPPFAFLQSFAVSINASKTTTKYITAILSSMGVLGRFSTFICARTLGPLNTTVFATLMCSICLYSWQSITSEASLIVFTIFYGFFSGLVGAFPPFIIPHLTTDITRLGVRIGMAFTTIGLFLLISIPLGGLTLGSSKSTDDLNFPHLSIFCGSAIMAGSLLLAVSRYFRAGFDLVSI